MLAEALSRLVGEAEIGQRGKDRLGQDLLGHAHDRQLALAKIAQDAERHPLRGHMTRNAGMAAANAKPKMARNTSANISTI